MCVFRLRCAVPGINSLLETNDFELELLCFFFFLFSCVLYFSFLFMVCKSVHDFANVNI